MIEEACANCHFYWNDECHRYAPRPTLSETREIVVWPEMDPDDWCGDWRPKIEAA